MIILLIIYGLLNIISAILLTSCFVRHILSCTAFLKKMDQTLSFLSVLLGSSCFL